MNTPATISATMDLSRMVMKKYVEDLTDAELLRRPGPGCNHVAWQLGHLIASECGLLESIHPGAAPTLPAGPPASGETPSSSNRHHGHGDEAAPPPPPPSDGGRET